jgi:hypothetical protein
MVAKLRKHGAASSNSSKKQKKIASVDTGGGRKDAAVRLLPWLLSFDRTFVFFSTPPSLSLSLSILCIFFSHSLFRFFLGRRTFEKETEIRNFVQISPS